MKSEMWWYTARAAGVVAWALSAVSVVWGLLLASPSLRRRTAESKLLDLHRFLGGLAAAFTVVHLVTTVAANRNGVGLVDVLVPITAAWEPMALTLGLLAALLLALVEVTSLLRARIGEALWRRAHYAGFGVFVLATVHGLQIGTDAQNPLLWWPAAATSAAVVGLCVARLVANGAPLRAAAVAAPAAGAEDLRPGPELLERTLEGLRNLEAIAPAPIEAPPAEPGFAVPPPPRPLRPSQAVSGSLFADDARSREIDDAPTRPEVPAPAFDVVVPPPPRPAAPAREVGPELPQPARHVAPAPVVAPVDPAAVAPALVPTARVLPVRTPRRLARTTAAAATIDGWQPQRATDTTPAGPPAPPTEIDPITGEPDPQAYRKWLREWLAYVESQA